MEYWRVQGDKLVWQVQEGSAHQDHLEMTGEKASVIVRYGVDEAGALLLTQEIVYPMLRTQPNNTRANSYVSASLFGGFLFDGARRQERPRQFEFDGVLTIVSSCGDVELTRHIYPSCRGTAVWERVVFRSTGESAVRVSSGGLDEVHFGRGVKGVYRFASAMKPFDVALAPGESYGVSICRSGSRTGEGEAEPRPLEDLASRRGFLRDRRRQLELCTDDPILDAAFAFAKIRACESVFLTDRGYLHSPGGGAYYAAVWANDQLEYASPFFPFTGDSRAVAASVNAYRLYLPFMGEDYRSIPSSIISEGADFWEGAGDRGDVAMYLYGLTRFLLANGDEALAEEFYPSVVWSAAYIRTRINADGVVESDSDELEGRFETGSANLCTSCLAYGGLTKAAFLARELRRAEEADEYEAMAAGLRGSIERYFGARVEGFDTYRYYQGNSVLRAWIAAPLTMGIHDRREGTVAALMSSRLWGENGLSTEAGRETFWDRSTLYALRGIFAAGETETAWKALTSYTRKRLLGEHVPYPVEAWPEGNQRHLSAESALYGRVVLEGLFGIEPVGFRSFTLSPSLPSELSVATLKGVRAFRDCFDIMAEKREKGYTVTITQLDGLSRAVFIKRGEQARVCLDG